MFVFDWGYRFEAMHQPDWGYCPYCEKKFNVYEYTIGFKVLNEEYSAGHSVGYIFFECPHCFEKSCFHDRYGDSMGVIIERYIKNKNDNFLKVLGVRESLVKALEEYLKKKGY